MGQKFPLNAWYCAAWDHEVGRKLLSRMICGKRIVLYRTQDGSAVALEDACWHRLVPLSMGELDGDQVRCGYHGLVYSRHGRCTHMPSQETVNPSARVRAFPVVERDRFLWVWPGDPALSDPALIPDLHWTKDKDWVGDGGHIQPGCDYRLVLDNLLDLTHETYLHPTTIGNDAVAETPFTTTHGARKVTVTRWMRDIEPPAFWGAQLGRPGNVDRWQIINFLAPSVIALDVGVAVAGTGAPEGDRSQGVSMWVMHIITPETENTCHYFWATARDYKLLDPGLTTQICAAVAGIFHEDHVMLEAQQQAIIEHPDHAFYNLNLDAGSMWMRRIIDDMIASENNEAFTQAAE